MNAFLNTILLVEDDIRLAGLIKEYLEQNNYRIFVEGRGDMAVERIRSDRPDMIILDLMLPGKDGLSILKECKDDISCPVLILTAREDDTSQIRGLELGADDYVQKPVDPRVLLARIRALFRRSVSGSSGQVITFGSLEIHMASRYVTLFGKPVDLSTIEFAVLAIFALSPGKVLDRDFLYQSVKGIEYDGLDRSMDVAISRLRKKLEDNPDKPFKIKTIWGSGYLFAPDVWGKEGREKASIERGGSHNMVLE